MSDTTQSDVVVDSSPQVDEVIESPIVDEVKTEGEETTSKVEAEKQEDENDDDSSLPNGVKKRIDKVTRQKYEAIAESNRLKAEIEQLRAQIAPKQEAPDISQFDTLDEYVEAVAEYKLSQKAQATQSQQAQQTQAQAQAQDWVAKVERFAVLLLTLTKRLTMLLTLNLHRWHLKQLHNIQRAQKLRICWAKMFLRLIELPRYHQRNS